MTKSLQPGVHDVDDATYFADPAINNSSLKAVLRSPAHYRYQMDHPKEPTPQMKAGTALHCAILEPDQFNARYAILPDNAPKEPTELMYKQANPKPDVAERVQFWTAFSVEAQGKEVLANDVAAEYLHIGHLIRTHPELAAFFKQGVAEQVIVGKDPVTGTLCKCKADWLTQVGKYRVKLEVKSTDDARYDAFRRTAYNLGYFQAAAFYMDVMDWCPDVERPDLYLIVAFERDPPYGVQIYEVPEEAVEFGRRRYRKALDLYAWCVEMNEWPNYDTTISLLELPPWAKEEGE